MGVNIPSNRQSISIGGGKTSVNFKTTDKDKVSITGNGNQVKTQATYTENLLANDYNTLKNKPSIEDVELKGNKTFEELGAICLSNLEIEKLLNAQL